LAHTAVVDMVEGSGTADEPVRGLETARGGASGRATVFSVRHHPEIWRKNRR
jgi:hypothetical protein